ncbi:hypothetical protein [Taibaiella koreensis]|uniref:hypothetical protein n=1 Tax=Taibaiella koreensis TaxID=1268548 RepID=UPI000E59BD48|nr:hypothetical protein [Taibaiella koreensis]
MNRLIKKELTALRRSNRLQLRATHSHFLQQYSHERCHALLEVLFNSWATGKLLRTEDATALELMRFYKDLSVLLEADYLLALREG